MAMTFGIATVRFAPGSQSGEGAPADTPAVVVDDRAVPLDVLLGAGDGRRAPGSVLELLPDASSWFSRIGAADLVPSERAGWVSTEEVEFLPPLPNPPTIYCAGANYRDHIEEMTGRAPDDAYAVPYHFLTPAGALSGHRAAVPRPPGCTQLDWEIELAVVIGRRAEHVSLDAALEYVAGYTVANDLSMRDFALRPDVPFGVDWIRSKGYTGCLPVGPTIIPSAFVPDPQHLSLSLSVNGEKMQDSSTALMLFSVAEQIAALSAIVPLLPGDLICTGTPAGVGFARGRFLEPGDVAVAEIEILGRLETRVVESASVAANETVDASRS